MPVERRQRAVSALLAAVSGVLVFLSFPRWDLWGLAWVACAPLVVACDGAPSWRALRRGLLTGLVANMGGFYWIVGLLRDYGSMPYVAGVPLYMLLCLQQGIVFAAAAWLYAGPLAALGGPRAIRFPAALVAAEFGVPMIFKWYLGNSQYANIPAAQLAELGGPLLVTAVLACIAGASVDVLRAFQRRAWREGAILGVAAVVLLVGVHGWGAARAAWIDGVASASPHLRVGIVEADIGIHEKAAAGSLDSNLALHQQLSVDAVADGAELLVWPETAYEASRFYQTSDSVESIEEALAAAVARGRIERDVTWMPASPAEPPPIEGPWGPPRHAGVPQRGFRAALIAGAILMRPLTPEERASWPPFSERPRAIAVYNSAMLLNPDGRVLPVVDKNVLMPFTEGVPGGRWLYRTTGINLYRIIPQAGDMVVGEIGEPPVLPDPHGRGAWRLGVMVCYEDILPGFSRALRHQDPHVLVNLTNDAWFGDTSEPWLHLALATFRAIEHRAALVRSTNTGVSAFIDPAGRIVAHTDTTGAEILVEDVPLIETAPGLFLRVGPWPGWLAVGALLAAIARRAGARPDARKFDGAASASTLTTDSAPRSREDE